MGKKAIDILNIDRLYLIEELNKALADEWLAFYQYWIGAKVVKGPMRTAVIAELEEHAKEELNHAVLLAERIIQLKGIPILKPEDWYRKTNCGYTPPSEDFNIKKILEQNLSGERCAISSYQKMLQELKDKDFITYNTILNILDDELEHEEDLENLLEDIAVLSKVK